MKQTPTNESMISVAAHAADNAAAAALSASEAAKSASENARIAAKATAESATNIAVVATDTTWMKGALVRVEGSLNEMNKAFVTAAQHAEVIKLIADHEIRIGIMEKSDTKLTVMLGIGTAILSILTSLLIYHLFQK